MIYLYGIHACKAALMNPLRAIEKVFIADETIIEKLPPIPPKKLNLIPSKKLSALLPQDAIHQGIALLVHPLKTLHLDYLDNLQQSKQIVLILDQISDPHNVGAIIRSSAVFGVTAIIMTANHAPQESGTLAKVASGALELVPIIKVSNISQSIKQLKSIGFWCYGLSEKAAQPLSYIQGNSKIAFVLGAEGKGMRQLTAANCDLNVYIPTTTNFTTLNVSNAAAVVLYALHSQ